MSRKPRRAIVVLVWVWVVVPLTAHAAGDRLLVFAAASLKNAMDGVVTAYAREHSGTVAVSYAGSSTLARQIERGAPAEVYVSANQAWMNELAGDGWIDTDSRVDLLRNAIVLVAPNDSDLQLDIAPGFDIVAALHGAPLAMANTRAVPAGIYGRQALRHLSVWRALQGHVAQASDVRAALALVARGEAPLGVVYASDALASDAVRVVDTFSADSHDPIVYPAAIIAHRHDRRAKRFMAFLQSDTAGEIFRRWGFALAGAVQGH